MGLVSLTAATIPALDGGIAGELIDAALASAVRDLDDRGDDGNKRKVTIEIEMTKDRGQVRSEVQVKTSIPPYRSRVTTGAIGVRKAGKAQVLFQEHDPENPDQATFPQMDSDEE